LFTPKQPSEKSLSTQSFAKPWLNMSNGIARRDHRTRRASSNHSRRHRLGVWNDRRIARLFREIGDRLDVINAWLGALEAKSNGSDPHAHLIDSGQMRRTAN
jgi:hypothetical protein